MSSSTWADYPFPLISTPAFNIGYTNKFIRSASKMALIHNTIIRGMNSIYLQCPHITPLHAADFITYCQCWSETIHMHHECEETAYFSLIEKAVGPPGTANENADQHEAFMGGLHEFDQYLAHVTPDTFSGTTMLQILDSFATKLQVHLTDEIVWIQSLAQSYPDLDMASIDVKYDAYARGRVTRSRILTFFMTNNDRTYENGIHDWWPPENIMRHWFLKYIFSMVHSGAWRYSSCSKDGVPKRLEVIKKDTDTNLEGGGVVETIRERPKPMLRIQSSAGSRW